MNCRICHREIWEPEFGAGVWHHRQIIQDHSSYELFDHDARPDYDDYNETPGIPKGWYLP
jgi:hypothetical protein